MTTLEVARRRCYYPDGSDAIVYVSSGEALFPRIAPNKSTALIGSADIIIHF